MVTLRGGSPPDLSKHPPALPLALPLARSLAGSPQRSSLLAHLSSTPAPIRSSSAAMLLPPRRGGTCLSLCTSRGNFGVREAAPAEGRGRPARSPRPAVRWRPRRGPAGWPGPPRSGAGRARRAAATGAKHPSRSCSWDRRAALGRGMPTPARERRSRAAPHGTFQADTAVQRPGSLFGGWARGVQSPGTPQEMTAASPKPKAMGSLREDSVLGALPLPLTAPGGSRALGTSTPCTPTTLRTAEETRISPPDRLKKKKTCPTMSQSCWHRLRGI